MSTPTLRFDDLKVHNKYDDCWIAVHSKVYDVTNFLEEHPGGSSSAFIFQPKWRRLLTHDSNTEIRGE